MNWDDILAEQEHLEHWGILGMKWGVRRYQNPDGSLTTAGRARYGKGSKSLSERIAGYKKARVAKIKEKTIRSGDIKTILKNKKYLTDTEFDKAVARAKKVKELKAETTKPKKEESEYSKRIKESITDSLTRKRDWKTPSTQEARDYDIAKSRIEAEKVINENKKTPLKKVNLMDAMSKTAKGITTYMTFAKVINSITGKKTFPTNLKDVGEKLGIKADAKSSDKKGNTLSTVIYDEKNNFDSAKWGVVEKKYEQKKEKQKKEKVVINPTWLDAPLNNLPKNDKKAESIIGDYSDVALDIFEEMYGK